MIDVRFLVLLFTGALATCGPPQPCVEVTPMEGFDVTQNDGVWYVVEKYPVAANLEEKCIIQLFQDLKDGSVRLVTELVGVESRKQRIDDGFAKFIEGEARFTENFGGFEYEEKWILETDYETYAVHFSCGEISPFEVNNVWIMAKTKQPDQEALDKAHEVLIRNGLSVDALVAEVWETCPKPPS